MDNIRSSNVYLNMPDSRMEGNKKEEEVLGEDADSDNDSSWTKGRRKRKKLPHWTRLPLASDDDDDEKAKYADWTLDVTVSNGSDDVVISYLVHKCLIGLQSDYFEGIFRDPEEGGFSESHQKRSAIKLPESVVVTIEHFEILLDYLYTDKLVIEPDNAVAMVYFGDYFGIELLQDQAQSFIRELIKTKFLNDIPSSIVRMQKLLTALYQDAKCLAMEELQEAIVYECAGKPRLMMSKEHCTSLDVLDKEFWCRVWDARKFHTPTELSTKLWSISVAHFIELHYSNIVDLERFFELTCLSSLPFVSAEVAVFLIEEEQRMRTAANEETAQKKDDDKKLTCLQQRCIDSLIDSDTGNWKIPKPRSLLQAKIQNLPPIVLGSMLLCTMNTKEMPTGTDSIRVSGAGSEVVNGVYMKSGLQNGDPIFTKVGLFEGSNVLFHLYRFEDGHFYITVLPEGSVLNTTEDINLYMSTNEEEDFSLGMSWETLHEGEVPSPTFQFV